jgi:hypothetical protein
MKREIYFLLLFVGIAPCPARTQVTDMKSLVGRKAIALRMPFYQPGTYQPIPNTYAGQTVTIIGVAPSTMYAAMPKLTTKQMASLPPQSRENIENVQNASTLIVQFADGTKADTGALPVMPSTLPSYLELVPDQSLANVQTAKSPTPVSDSLPPPADPTHVPVIQPTDMLSDDQVQQAINGSGKGHWTYIMDGGSGAPGLTPLIASITLYMPEAILGFQSASAKSQFLKYLPSDEDKRKSLVIFAHGSAGSTISEGCTSITRIVLLSDPSGRVVKEAYLSEPSTEVWRNGYGATNQCEDLRAKFSLEDVHKIKSAAPDGEFYVAVFSGAVNTKTYKIKKKFQSKLALE